MKRSIFVLLLLVLAVPCLPAAARAQSAPVASAVSGKVEMLPGAFVPAAIPATGTCGSAAHCTSLAWQESTPCVSPCTLTFNILRGTSAGGESATPINAAPVTSDTYVDPVTLTSAQQTFYYEVQAVETSGTIVQTATSAEVSASFPAILVAPAATATVQ